jgi:hypothetical protein
MFPKAHWKHLQLFALDATDLALSKLERNLDRDREDFELLYRADSLIFKLLKSVTTKSCVPIC